MDAKTLAKEINKVMGAETVLMASDERFKTTVLPTGVLPIDVLIDGGLPRGRFTEMYGAYSTLKSYVGLCAIATTQLDGGTAALIDTEHAYDKEWAESLGVNTEDLILQRPTSGEEAVDVTEALVRAEVDLIVWDSVAATLPETERDKREAGVKHQPARLAALMSRATRKLTAANKKTAILWINQTRMSIGVTFGNPEVVPGGKSLPFYSSYRVSVRRSGRITRDKKVWTGEKYSTVKETVQHGITASVEKSKLSAPTGVVHFKFDLEQGEVDELGFLISWALENGLIVKNGRKWTDTETGETFDGQTKLRKAVEGDSEWSNRLYSTCLGSLPHRNSTD